MIQYPYYPLMWAVQVLALFVGFTVQGAMWRAAQDENRNGWVIALLWAVMAVAMLNGIHAAQDLLFPHVDS